MRLPFIDPGRMGAQVAAMPFSAGRRFKVDHMTQSYARIRMPLGGANADISGSFHEGALLALLDTTGAIAAWAATRPGWGVSVGDRVSVEVFPSSRACAECESGAYRRCQRHGIRDMCAPAG